MAILSLEYRYVRTLTRSEYYDGAGSIWKHYASYICRHSGGELQLLLAVAIHYSWLKALMERLRGESTALAPA